MSFISDILDVFRFCHERKNASQSKKTKQRDSMKAELTCIFHDNGSSGYLLINNNGKSNARNILINYPEKSKIWTLSPDIRHSPYPYINAGESLSIKVSLITQGDESSEITIQWDDDYSDNRTYKTIITIP